uniref:Uncharacterized protein n=1 Tax=Ditylenchus dipsaci TaxID=166011 RepID=A0A915EAC5_9BILA
MVIKCNIRASFSNPDQIRRFRLLIALSQAASDSKFVDVFRLRMRWIDPEYWNDNFNETDRVYELKCEIEDEDSGMTFTFFEIHTDSLISGYDENFVVHESLPLLLRCRIRAKNSYGLEGRWKWSKTVKLYKLYSHPITSEPDSDLRRYKHFSERPTDAPIEVAYNQAEEQVLLGLVVGQPSGVIFNTGQNPNGVLPNTNGLTDQSLYSPNQLQGQVPPQIPGAMPQQGMQMNPRVVAQKEAGRECAFYYYI